MSNSPKTPRWERLASLGIWVAGVAFMVAAIYYSDKGIAAQYGDTTRAGLLMANTALLWGMFAGLIITVAHAPLDRRARIRRRDAARAAAAEQFATVRAEVDAALEESRRVLRMTSSYHH